MEIAIIAPTAMLNEVCNNKATNVQMCHAHRVLSDKTYADFYADASKYTVDTVIMNSSFWEPSPAMNTSDLLKACRMIFPTELILPGVFRKGPETIASIELFIENTTTHRYECPWLKNFAVAQGRDREEWLTCFDHLNKLESVHVIGLSKDIDDTWYPGGRLGAALYLQATGRVKKSKKYHALGIYNPLEAVSLATLGWIRSLSTSLPIHAGLQGIRFDHTFGLTTEKPKGPHIYFDASSEECQIALEDCKHNISVMRSWSTMKEKDSND